MPRDSAPYGPRQASREDLLQAARNYLAACEPEHPVQDLLNIDSPAFGSSDLIVANPSRTRLHIARFCIHAGVHEFLVDSMAFGCWTREMLGVSTRLFRTSAAFTLYLFAPYFPDSAHVLLSPISGWFQVELVPYTVIRIEGRQSPVIHLFREPPRPPLPSGKVWDVPSIPPAEAPTMDDPPAGLTAEEIAEFARLETLYFGR